MRVEHLSLLTVACLTGLCGCSGPEGVPRALLRDAPPIALPGVPRPDRPGQGSFDCNNPAHWSGDTLYTFSSAGHPWRGAGKDLFSMKRPSVRITYDNQDDWTGGGRWIEATYKDNGGVLYGWYHNEPKGICEKNKWLTAPRIGAAVSYDDGLNWKDLGVVLDAPDGAIRCDTANRYFVGGNGDFSVIVDRDKKYLYFLISTYHADVAEQGVSIARMPYAERDDPVGKAVKWHRGAWGEPGLGGHVTPILPVAIDWNLPDADAPWGPSIHWNTHLSQYVILLNRAKDKTWAQEGVYVTFNPDLADPDGWSLPDKVYDGHDHGPKNEHWWYPQVVGIDAARRETDKLAGKVARFFIRGKSQWEIVFLRPNEKQE